MKSLALIVLGICLFSQLSFAGSLEPTAAPGSTMKPLDQVEPRIAITSLPLAITQSGSYYLTKNLTATDTAITISVDDVTIDLSGYTITGPGSTGFGIHMGGRDNVEICNGTIRNFSTGIYNNVLSANAYRVIGIRTVSTALNGIYLWGRNHLVRDCIVNDNGVSGNGMINGIFVDRGSVVADNIVYNNGFRATSGSFVYGIYAGEQNTVSGNVIYLNGCDAFSNKINGICASYSSIITDNTVLGNGSSAATQNYGINTYTNCKINSNTVTSNYGDGIYAGDHCSLTGNIAANNFGTGIITNSYCAIKDCTANSNSSRGINTGKHCVITSCQANRNSQRGIHADDYSTITNSTASFNSEDGIWAMSYCSVTGCNASENQKVGIFCWSGAVVGNTVSNNNQIDNSTLAGIQIWGATRVEKNTCTDNKQKNIWINNVGSTVEGNHLRGSVNAIHFASGGNYYKDNRSSGTTGTTWSGNAGNSDGGGNVAF